MMAMTKKRGSAKSVWLVYHGLRLGLPYRLIGRMPVSRMLDLLACDQIYHGVAEDVTDVDDEDMIPIDLI